MNIIMSNIRNYGKEAHENLNDNFYSKQNHYSFLNKYLANSLHITKPEENKIILIIKNRINNQILDKNIINYKYIFDVN